MQNEIRRNVRFNFAVNVFDGGFFGMALGFASFVTIFPLFVSKFTDSSILIGLIASLHLIGWQLPQILTANHVARLRRFKPMVIRLTVHERWPFLALALVALASPSLDPNVTLLLIFVLVGWQAFGGGFAATAWQSMVAKIMPAERRGTFYGAQSALANLLSSGGSVAAGIILLGASGSNEGFAVCFLIAGILMFFSFAFITRTREPESPVSAEPHLSGVAFRRGLWSILRKDKNYRLFIIARMLIQAASVGSAFYTVFAVQRFHMDEAAAGILTAVYLIAATIGNPLFGWLGDHWSRRLMFAFGGLLAGLSAAVALLAPSANWFIVVYALFGLSNGASWTSANAMTVDFSSERERPYYIGLGNTLVAPVTLLAPMFAGWLADTVSHEATFSFAAAAGLLTALVAFFVLREPHERTHSAMRETAETAAVTGIAG